MKHRGHKLTDKQKKFVAEYQIDLNGTQAAIRAGYSPRRAETTAVELRKLSWVSEAIEKQTEAALHKAGVRRDKVLTQMARISFHDIRRLYDPKTNTLLEVKDFPDDMVAAVAGVETLEVYAGKGEDRHLVGYTKKVRLWDPSPSLTNMAKNLRVIGNGKHAEEEETDGVKRVWTSIEFAAKLVFYKQILTDLAAEIEGKNRLEGEKKET